MEDEGTYNPNNAGTWNYRYDPMGRIISNRHDGIARIEYNAYNKIKRVVSTDNSRPTLEYTYDAMQQLLNKKAIEGGGNYTETFYAYDAMGVLMSTYTHHHTAEGNTITLNDFMAYGSSRLGSYIVNEPEGGTTAPVFTAANLRFELTDHLGTVRAVITGEKTGEGEAKIISLTDYYPYGMDMPGRTYMAEQYRYGYQGSERDPEMLGGAGYTTYFRALDPRIGRWLTPDAKVFPWQSPYVSMDGNPVALVDVWGASTDGPDAIVGENKDGFSNLISGVDVVAPTGNNSNKLLLSGDSNRPEPFPVPVPNQNNESSAWVSALKSIAFVMEVAVPYAGYVKELNNIADNGGSISSCPNMIENVGRDVLEKHLGKVYKEVEGKTFTVNNMGNANFKKGLSIGKGAAKVKGAGLDMVNVMAKMIVDDLEMQIEQLSVAQQIAELVAISDYEEFLDAAWNINSDPSNNDQIIVLYSNKPIVSGPGETFDKGNMSPSKSVFISTKRFAGREEYNGFVPQYVSWGFKSGYSGNSMIIMKAIKINYGDVQIQDNRGY